MAKVNINETATTKTASGGKESGSQRGKAPSSNETAVDVGVKMSASTKKPTKVTVNETPKPNPAKVSGAKSEATPTAKKPVKTIIVQAEDVSGKSDKSTTAKPAGKTTAKPKTTKAEQGLVVRKKEIDPEIALMASRAAAEETVKPDAIFAAQGNGKSMSGMVDRRRRHINTAYSINAERDKIRAELTEKKEAEAAESQLSKLKSTLIGVGVALVVAVIGFTGIAIFGNNKKMCAINFESNGGTKVAATEIVCGRTVKEPDSPTKDGFTFDGWILEGDPFDFSTGIYKNATLVAKWVANDGTEVVVVHFDSDGGTKVDDIEVAKGKTLVRPTAPTKAGYVFDDWYLDGKVYDFKTPVTKDITLKAKWERRQTTNNNSSSNDTAKQNNHVTSLTVADATVDVGASAQIAIAIVPSNAEYKLIVSSSDASVADCNVTGANITCVGKKPGQVTVTVRDSLSGNRDDFTLTVNDKKEPEVPPETEEPKEDDNKPTNPPANPDDDEGEEKKDPENPENPDDNPPVVDPEDPKDKETDPPDNPEEDNNTQ